MGFSQNIATVARNWAGICMDAGLDGVVCSPQEARDIKELNGERFLTVCPGIRPADSAIQDQKRIASPAGALANGADYLVIGRPITQAEEPQIVVKNILKEMER
jgi:orotidine-5'-phosphate decarboxylase